MDGEPKHAAPAAVADTIRAELGIGSGLERFATGSVPVFASGGAHVIKLFPTNERAFFEAERAALVHIDGALVIPTPRLVAAGERDGWWYVVMSRLPGRLLSEAWPDIGRDDQRRVVREVGAALAQLHGLPTEGLPALSVDWPRFLDEQRAGCRARHVAKGVDPAWLVGLDDFLGEWSPTNDGRRALLHTEIMREHVLVEQRHGAWRASGLFDFEPAMLGAPAYEFASIGVFLTCGDPELMRTVLDAYGIEPDEALPMRLMSYALLHRYSNLRWHLERVPFTGATGDLEGLARRWFGVA